MTVTIIKDRACYEQPWFQIGAVMLALRAVRFRAFFGANVRRQAAEGAPSAACPQDAVTAAQDFA